MTFDSLTGGQEIKTAILKTFLAFLAVILSVQFIFICFLSLLAMVSSNVEIIK